MKLAVILPPELSAYEARLCFAPDGTAVVEVAKRDAFGPDAAEGKTSRLEAVGQDAGRLISFHKVSP